MSTILVTGGAGFIGSHVCDRLIEYGHEVRCFDNLATGKRQNVAHLKGRDTFNFVRSDINDLTAVKKALDGIDAVVHLAALGSVPRSIKFPKATQAANLTGFLNVLESCREARVARFVFASSSSVYGNEKSLPKTEERIGRPLSPYAVTKLMDEVYARLYRHMYDMETIGLRFFNVFGERQDPEGAYAAAIPKFLKCLMAHEPPQVHGDGKQTRDFTYVLNAAQAVVDALQTNDASAFGKSFNIAYGSNKDLNTLIGILKEELTLFDPQVSSIEPVHGPDRAGDVRDSLADISRSEALLGYSPQFDLRQGLKRAVPWYWENWR